MDTTNEVLCTCGNCAGPGCTCGCQEYAAQGTCACAGQCDCGEACACAAGQA